MTKVTQRNFDSFLENQKVFAEALNHRMTKVEGNTRWMKWIMGYMATILTGIIIKLIFLS